MTPAWAFVFDGHIFYVLNDVNGNTMICDLRTGQWHHWYTGVVAGKWNMYRGVVWKGRVLAADELTNEIWEADPHSFLDEAATDIKRVVTAFESVRGKGSVRQGSLRISASVGFPTLVGATLQMRFSDNEGQSWSPTYSRTLVSGDFNQELRFRSLGRLREPGRIWEISDTGGVVTIEAADADLEGR